MNIAELKRLIEAEEHRCQTWITQQLALIAQRDEAIQQRLKSVMARVKTLQGVVDRTLTHSSARIQQEVKCLQANSPPYMSEDWDSPRWETFVCGEPVRAAFLPVGTLAEDGPCGFRVPFFVPLIGRRRTLVFQASGENEAKAHGAMQALALRIALMMPYEATFTLLSPQGEEQVFPLTKPLAKWLRRASTNTADLLSQVHSDSSRILQTYLNGADQSFEDLPQDIRSLERFEFILVPHFPRNYGRQEIELLQSLSEVGPRAGRYLFIHYNSEFALPPGIRMEDFGKVHVIDVDQSTKQTGTFKLLLSTPPPAPVQKSIFRILFQAKPPANHFRFNDVAMRDTSDWWTESVDERVEAVVGISSTRDPLRLWFGVSPDGRPCAHGMLGAMTGSGKSNFYHGLICSLALCYSPRELSLFLIDGKDGVEFQDYRELPHARAVVLHSPSEMSRSVLAELVAEKERRHDIIAQTGVTNLREYRKAGQPKGILPVILVLVDECQDLFEDDCDGIASRLVLVLSQQGRSAGIHLLLGSQRFTVVGMQHQAAIMGNVHLRLAMKMTLSDVQSLTDFGKEGKQSIASCKLPGQIVVNDESGDPQANTLGKVAFLSARQRKDLVADLVGKAVREGLNHTDRVIFDGLSQPELTHTAVFRNVLASKSRPTAAEWEAWARSPMRVGGFDEADWYDAELPHVFWLGREYTMYGHARAIVRCRPQEHVLVAGGAPSARYAMVSASVASLALVPEPASVQVTILDQSIPRTPWHDALESTCRLVLAPAGISHTFSRSSQDAAVAIEKFVEELDQRLPQSAEQRQALPSLFLFVTDPDRLPALARVLDKFKTPVDSPLGSQLRRLLCEGSAVGIHLILSFALVAPMLKLLDRSALDQFRHRIALQMSDDDSLAFIQNRKAALLQAYGQRPISALYKDTNSDRVVRFKPYVCDGPVPLVEELRNIGNQIKQWRKS